MESIFIAQQEGKFRCWGKMEILWNAVLGTTDRWLKQQQYKKRNISVSCTVVTASKSVTSRFDIYTYIHTYIHTYINTYIRTHTHTHIHTQTHTHIHKHNSQTCFNFCLVCWLAGCETVNRFYCPVYWLAGCESANRFTVRPDYSLAGCERANWHDCRSCLLVSRMWNSRLTLLSGLITG